MYYRTKPGTSKVIDIVKEVNDKSQYKGLSKDRIVSQLPRLLKNCSLRDKAIRYDFKIHIKHEVVKFRYKVFIKNDADGKAVFCEDRTMKQAMNNLKAGPGYFVWPEYSTSRFDIIETYTKSNNEAKRQSFQIR